MHHVTAHVISGQCPTAAFLSCFQRISYIGSNPTEKKIAKTTTVSLLNGSSWQVNCQFQAVPFVQSYRTLGLWSCTRPESLGPAHQASRRHMTRATFPSLRQCQTNLCLKGHRNPGIFQWLLRNTFSFLLEWARLYCISHFHLLVSSHASAPDGKKLLTSNQRVPETPIIHQVWIISQDATNLAALTNILKQGVGLQNTKTSTQDRWGTTQ